MQKPKIVFRLDGTAYIVKETTNTLRVDVGDILKRSEVQDLIDGRSYTIVIKEK